MFRDAADSADTKALFSVSAIHVPRGNAVVTDTGSTPRAIG